MWRRMFKFASFLEDLFRCYSIESIFLYWTTVEMQSIKQRRRIRMAASDFLLLCCVIYRISTNAFVHIGHWNVGCRRCGASGILFISRVKNHICGASRSGESLTTLLTKKKSKKKGKNKRIHHHWQCGGGVFEIFPFAAHLLLPLIFKMADLEAVLADVSYLMAMEKSKNQPASRASKKIILPDPSVRSVMHKYLEKAGEVTFKNIFGQKLGKLGIFFFSRGKKKNPQIIPCLKNYYMMINLFSSCLQSSSSYVLCIYCFFLSLN
ncbi:hypothetical protein D917_00412 [Trichinella nativa]|uniref:Uncharacterized protein n=1 Tax=Trichinella nativa TaxID=6335 RepID=A0A1Y3E9P1_9BILA|nr:hypothetical protein D917_00412 [Trichinella nativa]